LAASNVAGEWVTVPLVNDAGEEVTTSDNPHGNNVEGDDISVGGCSTQCLNGPGKQTLTVAISNMPTGLINFLDAPYSFRVTNTGNKAK
jgi:hypothetical protein